MARARSLKPSFFTNDELADIPPLGRLLFQGLWTLADRRGRLVDRPKKIKAEVLPYDDCDVEAMLQALERRRFIQRYAVDGERYIQITTFEKHQAPHYKEPESTIPPPPAQDRPIIGQSSDIDSRVNRADSGLRTPDSGLPPPPSDDRPIDAARSSNGAAAAPSYLDLLNGALPNVERDFSAVDVELTPNWLREALVAAQSRAGPLTADQLLQGLEVAITKIERAADPNSPHPIRNMTGFATKAVISALIGQRTHAASQ